MAVKKYNTTFRNLEYRLRRFKDSLPGLLEDIIRDKESVIISAIADDQLFRRGVNGVDVKIMDYAPYSPRTIKRKNKKGQPTTRVTLRDTGEFHESMFIVFEPDGFYVTSNDDKMPYIVKKYGEEIFRLTDKNLTRILNSHIRKELVKRLKLAIKQ